MSKERPDHHDAQLAFQLYDFRRETAMRKARELMISFQPKSWEELFAVTKWDHALNQAWRQVGSYWEMVYATVKHGIVHPEYFMETVGEGLILYVKVEPYLARYRQEISPLAFVNAEWVATNTDRGRKVVELFRKRFGIAPPAK
jgi:hypothetical protein